MKTNTWVRWVFTALAAALMVLSALPDVLRVPGAVMVFRHLGYPAYLLPFLGTAKLLGVAAVLAPGVPRIKEWAFAGLTFDLVGALYSHLSIGDPPNVWIPAAVGLMLVSGAYGAHRLRMEPTPAPSRPTVGTHNEEGYAREQPRH
jgi:hypothetical protein